MRDRLSDYPGLNAQPSPGSAGFDTLQSEIEFMLLDRDYDNTKEGRKLMAKALLRFFVGRGYWPLGTQCRVTKKMKVKTVFPGEK